MSTVKIRCWSGKRRLTFLEHLSIASIKDAGHPVAVYSYAPIENLPLWAEPGDAGAILPERRAEQLGDPELIERAFSYALLTAEPGAVYVSLSTCLTSELKPRNGYLFGWQSEEFVGTDCLAMPSDSKALSALRKLSQSRTDGRWGELGSYALTHVLRDSGEISHALPRTALYPLRFSERRLLTARKANLSDFSDEQTLAVPLFSDATERQLLKDQGGVPKYWSPLGELLRKHGVPVRQAPLPGTSDTTDRWTKEPDLVPLRSDAKELTPAPEPSPLPKRVMIVTTMKNEGPFILEWIAYHRSIGITDFLVYTNDCDDGTVELLDLLAEKGWITARIDNPFKKSKANDWQRSALWDAQNRSEMSNIDWVIPMDVDEFINIHVGEGKFSDLLGALPNPNMISMVWRLFGSSFHAAFEDQPITRSFTWAARPDISRPANAWGFKTAFKPNEIDAQWSVHRPMKLQKLPRRNIRWYLGTGAEMAESFIKTGWRVGRRHAGYDLVSLNHYAVRSCESYLVKRQRGRVNHIDQDQGIAYWFRMNHNGVEDRSIQNKLPAATKVLNEIMADSSIAEQHHACVAAHRQRIEDLKGMSEYADLFETLCSPWMRNLSRLTHHFGNWIFSIGPRAIPDDYQAWAQNMREDGSMPDEIGPAPGLQSSGTILPRPEVVDELNANRKSNLGGAKDITLEPATGNKHAFAK